MAAAAEQKSNVDPKKITAFVEDKFEKEVIKELSDYIAIPNQSPMFDKDVHTNGLQEQAAELMVKWAKKQPIKGMAVELIKEQGRTPLICITIDGSDNTQQSVMMYGHLDKQPPLTEDWLEGLGPHKPVIKDGKLYGRGGADDGYAIFSALVAIGALQAQGVKHSRIVMLVEACEESGSGDLPYYVDKLQKTIGEPSLIICLDSGAGNYDQMWLTTSLRGMTVAEVKVEILTESQHSGSASGIVPSSFRILRTLLDRVEDSTTGEIKLKEFYAAIPDKHKVYAKDCAAILGAPLVAPFPFVSGAQPMGKDLDDRLLNKWWRPTLSITGADGIPSVKAGGNVIRPFTSVKCSMRLPPTVDPPVAAAAFKAAIEKDPPYGARVTCTSLSGGSGWMAPLLEPWLEKSLEAASKVYFGRPPAFLGEGGSIPFMGMLGKKFPKSQFVITGVLGPNSNAHGPNEFLHIQFCKNLTGAVANILADQYVQFHKA